MKPYYAKVRQNLGPAARIANLRLVCSQAEALRDAKALAFEVGRSDSVSFGFPVVWTCKHALLYLPSGALDPDVDCIPLCGPIALSREEAIVKFTASPEGFLQLEDVPKAIERARDIQICKGLLQRVACPCVNNCLVASYFDQTASFVFAARIASVVDSRANRGKSLSDAVSCAIVSSQVRRWLADTGCGHDLVDRDEIKSSLATSTTRLPH